MIMSTNQEKLATDETPEPQWTEADVMALYRERAEQIEALWPSDRNAKSREFRIQVGDPMLKDSPWLSRCCRIGCCRCGRPLVIPGLQEGHALCMSCGAEAARRLLEENAPAPALHPRDLERRAHFEPLPCRRTVVK